MQAFLLADRVPLPSHRHATPSGPWPWMDYDSENNDAPPPPPPPPPLSSEPAPTDSDNWRAYPQNRFPNWTAPQIARSRIADVIYAHRASTCTVYRVDVARDGMCVDRGGCRVVSEADERGFWECLECEDSDCESKNDVSVRALFVEDISGPVMQMLGTRYGIEPFYFSSALNWIPSRVQADLRPGKGDHVTITLTFLRTIDTSTQHNKLPLPASSISHPPQKKHNNIDVQAPLVLDSNNKTLLLDLCALHIIRGSETSIMISYHPPQTHRTTARKLQSRLDHAGQSVYWNHIWARSRDPTFILLATMWHALYAWDEALEALYDHFCTLEFKAMHRKHTDCAEELYAIHAHLLHWSSLLDDLRKSVRFVRDTPYPALSEYDESAEQPSRALLEKECANMLTEIERLDKARSMLGERVDNILELLFATVSIEDSRRMQRLSQIAARDSSAMRLISLLTIIYLPATLVASVFGMNISALNPGTLGSVHAYFATMVPLTILTVCLFMSMRSRLMHEHSEDASSSSWRFSKRGLNYACVQL